MLGTDVFEPAKGDQFRPVMVKLPIASLPLLNYRLPRLWQDKMVSLSQASADQPTGPRPLILGVPFEVRLTIYRYILDDIHHERRQWEKNATSTYDSLQAACRQLSHEVSRYIFATRITSYQTSKLANLYTNRLTFFSLRSLSIELDLALIHGDVEKLAKALDVFQLSLQELHLLFFGQDRHGNQISASGCANRTMCHKPSSKPLLLESGQDTEKKLNLLRILIGCRNLRILRIENANLPLLPALFMIDKPYLQAFSATCDPRSITHRYMAWKHRRDVLKGLLLKIDPKNVPPIRALHIDANAAVPPEDVVQCLKATLQHLSWRVPNPDFQGYLNRQNDFYKMTDTIFRLFWSIDRAPKLETLRLCCDMRDLPSSNPRYQWDMDHLVGALSSDLPRFQRLKHFEIHYSGGDNFIRNQLIESLPHGLQRLYISDVTITVQQLVSQVRERYFSSTQNLRQPLPAFAPIPMIVNSCSNRSHKPRIESLPLHELPDAKFISVNARGQTKYLSSGYTNSFHHDVKMMVERCSSEEQNCLGKHFMSGESKVRRDEIPLSTGKLGFITFEYGHHDGQLGGDGFDCLQNGYDESDQTKIFKLNGQLLDREHNLHLAHDQAMGAEYGIKPSQSCKTSAGETSLLETETYSKHSVIYAAIYNNGDLAPKLHLVKQNLKDLAACPERDGKEEKHDDMAWYFGNEEEAMKVFEEEPVAKVEDQRQKPMLSDVEVAPSTRCKWMCPDLEVPPVGSFPRPTVPSDWKDLVRAI